MSRTIRKNKQGKVVCDKDTDYKCRCSSCTGETYWKKEKKNIWKDAEQEELDSSSDMLEFHAPEKEVYLERHFGHVSDQEENAVTFFSEKQSQQKVEDLLDRHAPDFTEKDKDWIDQVDGSSLTLEDLV